MRDHAVRGARHSTPDSGGAASLRPTASLARLIGAGHTYVPRQPYDTRGISPDSAEMCDSLTGTCLTVAGPMRVICHQDAASWTVIELLQMGGHAIEAELLTYRDRYEYHELLQAVGTGKAVVQHAHPLHELPLDRYAVPRELLVRLTDKGRLHEFVPAEHVPKRRSVSTSHLVAEVVEGALPVVVKASCDDSLGGGDGVRICTSLADARAAADDFAASPFVVLEEHLAIAENWCLNFAVDLVGNVHYLGAIEQVVSAAGVHLGSRIGRPAPIDVVDVGRAVTERARDHGYLGIAGTDIAITSDGRLLVLDLNFRLNGCTPALMLWDSLIEWGGRGHALSTGFRTDLDDNTLLKVVAEFIAGRVFVPTGAFLPYHGHRKVNGVVVADQRSRLEETLAALASAGLRWSGTAAPRTAGATAG